MADWNRRQFITAAGVTAAAVGVGAVVSNQLTKKNLNRNRFKGKVITVAGATSGIGAAAAQAFAAEGAKVFFCGRRVEKGKEVENLIKKNGGDATYFQADVTIEDQVRSFMQACVKQYGSIDIAYNNVGIGLFTKAVTELEEHDWDQQMNTNAKGMFFTTKYAVKQMLVQKSGVILNMSSIGGNKAMSSASAYTASKHAIVGFTKSVAIEVGPQNIRVNSISPGLIETGSKDQMVEEVRQHPDSLKNFYTVGRMGKIEEVVNAVLWLCSNEASYVHASDVHLDGGLFFG